MPTLYYYISWPESQRWLNDDDAIYKQVVPYDDGCFVEKEYYEENEE